MKVRLIAHTPHPEKVVAAAAKLCYSNADIDSLLDGLTEEKSKEFVEMLAGLGHESPIEHASFTFAVEGVSRALLAQITRHRHASFSVQSQRYVKLEDFSFVLPPEVEAVPEAKELFLNTMVQEAEMYTGIAKMLEEKHFEALAATGMEEKAARRAASKQAIEDARFVLPNACTTKMILTMNARSLLNFFRLRCCERAQWEIHALADEMLRLCYAVAPALFKNAGPGCVGGGCTEGKMSCKRAAEVRKRYAGLKNEALHG